MSKMNEQVLQDVLSSAEYRKVRLDQIQPAPYNPRIDLTPEDPEYQKIKRSILDHGFVQPIVFNEQTGYAAGGNQRLKILKELGVEEAVCAVIHVPLVREMEISVALNKHDNLWDQEKLREIMLQFKQEDYDATKTGFDQEEFQRLTQEMSANISGFFQQEETEEKEQVTHEYKCPYCGTVFVK